MTFSHTPPLMFHNSSDNTMPVVPSTDSLPGSPLFQYCSEDCSVEKRINLSYMRAKALALSSGLNLEDIVNLTPKFLGLCTHPVVTLDGGAVLLVTIQLNLGVGTIAPYVHDRPDLRKLVDDLLAWRVGLAYMLTEVAHGLDAESIETTATLCEDGTFDLHTPNDDAAKFMPPTLPCGETPRVGLVMARLIIQGEDRGVRPFVVPLNDGNEMCAGVTARELPTRVGSRAVGHSITQFCHVRLPSSSLLGKLETIANKKKQLQEYLQRVTVGSLVLASCIIPALKISAFVGAKYSQRRHVVNQTGAKMPIISFRTQQVPILYTLAQGFVMDAFFKTATSLFVSSQNTRVRNAITAVVKATMFHHWKKTGVTIADRCGAQGMFGFNQLASLEMELRGASIAEGDVLVLCIRLASELILGRYSLPPASYPDSPLAQHEVALLQECRAMLSEMGGSHRSTEFNNLILPRCLPLVEAIGFRMAWEAALLHKVPPALVKLYELGAISSDLPWYIERTDVSRDSFARAEVVALSDVLQNLDAFLDAAEVESSAVAAMLSDESWKRLVSSLPLHEGKTSFNPFLTEPQCHGHVMNML